VIIETDTIMFAINLHGMELTVNPIHSLVSTTGAVKVPAILIASQKMSKCVQISRDWLMNTVCRRWYHHGREVLAYIIEFQVIQWNLWDSHGSLRKD